MRRPTAILLTTIFLFFNVAAPSSADDAAKKKGKTKAIQAAAVKLGRPVDFQKDIYPIFENNCVACHNVAIDESKFVVEDVKSILKGGKRGPAVVPKQPAKSLLFQLVTRGKGPAMPPMPNKVDAKALTPRELGLIRQWILEGASVGSSSKGGTVNWAPLPVGLNPIYSVALSPWGRLAAAGRSNQITIYDLASGEELATLADPALKPIKYDGKPMYPGGAAHRDFVHSLAFSPDGNLLASGGYRVVKLWQRPRNVKHATVAAGAPVTSVAISPDGKQAAFAAGKSIQIVDTASGKVIRKLSGHTGNVTAAEFSPDGKQLVSSSTDKTVQIWNLASGKSVRKIETPAAVNDVTFNKDATLVVSAGADNLLRVWKTAKPAPSKPSKPAKPAKKAKKKQAQSAGEKPVVEMKGHSKPVTSVALVLPAGTQVVSGSEDGTVRIWTISNGRQSRSMNHGGPVTAVAARPDGQFVASASMSNSAKLWQVNNGRQIAEMKGRLGAMQRLATLMETQAVAKQHVASANSAVKAAEKNLKDRETALTKSKTALTAADKALAAAKKKAKPENDKLKAAKDALAKKPKDNALKKKVAAAQKAADKVNAELKKATDTHAAAKRTAELGEKSVKTAKDKLAAAKKSKTDAETRQKTVDAELKSAQDARKTLEKPIRAIDFSADGSKLVTAGDDNVVHVWNGNDGRHLEEYSGHGSQVTAVACGAGNVLISGSADKSAIVWNTKPAWKLVGRLGAADDAPLDLSNSPFVSRVLALAFSPDGRLIATGGGDPSRSGELMIWDVAKRSMIREIEDAHSDTVLGLEFSRDGKLILSGAADKFAKIHDVATGKKVRSFEGHTHHVLDVSWQADGSVIATAGADNVLKVWNVATGEQKRSIGGYSKQVTSVQFIGVGNNIVSCGGDKSVRFHRTTNGQNYRRFSGGTDYMYASAAARDASAVVKNVANEATVVVAGGEDGVLRVWTGTAQVVKTFEPPKKPVDETTQVKK